jgi:hypothetical protein
LSLDDALKLDDVRDALRRGDLHKAGRLARVFTLTPLALDTTEESGKGRFSSSPPHTT